MKKLLLLALALSLPLAQMVRADNDNKKKHKRQDETAANQQAGAPARQAVRQPVRQSVQRNVAPNQRSIVRTPHSVANERAATRTNRSVAPGQRQSVRSEANLDGRNRQRADAPNQANNQNQKVNRGNRNVNRGNRTFDRNSFNVARTRVIRGHHDRNWWRSRYNTTFVLFGGGYYYWWDNYWYPAYGYSPIYNNYAYSEPIYGYNNLAPGQVLENVQLALRDQGYYTGAIDGLIGPQTRDALAAFQRDNGLEVTAAVDEPTLVTLGLA